MTKLKFNLKNLLIFALLLIAFAQLPQQTSAQTNSSENSKTVTVDQSLIDNCSKAVFELEVYDKLIESKEAEIKLLTERVQLEREKSEIALELASARKGEAENYKAANEALNTAIAAKDSQIKNLEKEVEILKKKKPSLMSKILQIAAGVGIGILLK